MRRLFAFLKTLRFRRDEYMRERRCWHERIFAEAKRAGVSTKGLGQGEVLTKMAGEIIYQRGMAADWKEAAHRKRQGKNLLKAMYPELVSD